MTDSTQPPENNSGLGGQGGQGGYPPPPSGQPAAGGYQPPTYEQGQYGQQPGYGGYGPAPTNGLAIAALVVGILALLTFWTVFGGIILGIAGVILGAMGLSKANKIGGVGKGMAIGGLVTALLGGLLSVLIVAGLVAAFDNVDFTDNGITVDGTEFEFSTEQ